MPDWFGAYGNLLASIFPLVLLIYLMTKKRSLPSYKVLPLAAVLLFIIKVLWFRSPLIELNATVIDGLLTALKPILIVWGAIFLFKAMEHSGSMATLRTWLNCITANRVAQVMIVGWAFSFLIEGASGFGTPVAIATPILVGLGFEPVATVVVCLVFNSVPVTFGAVGMPTWFGLGELGLGWPQLVRIGFFSALINAVAALVIPLVGLLFVVPKRQIKANLGFIYLSVLACVLPYVIVSAWSCEFPSIVGGLVGTILSVFFAHKGIGLAKENIDVGEMHTECVSPRQLLKASFPLWGTVLILIATRVDYFGLKALLNADTPACKISLGKIGILSISAALSVTLKNILGTSTSWNHKFLYIPSIIPFFVVGFASFRLLHTSKADIAAAWNESLHRMRHPVIALLGILVFAKLFMFGGESSCTMIIGRALADAAGRHWYWFASLLGALGSFFAGSNTVSNLTFAPIQDSIGRMLCLNMTVVLALQSVGGALGKMVCIHDIVAGCSVIGITGLEGRILKRTVIPMLLYAIIAAMCVPLLLTIL